MHLKLKELRYLHQQMPLLMVLLAKTETAAAGAVPLKLKELRYPHQHSKGACWPERAASSNIKLAEASTCLCHADGHTAVLPAVSERKKYARWEKKGEKVLLCNVASPCCQLDSCSGVCMCACHADCRGRSIAKELPQTLLTELHAYRDLWL